MFKNNPKYQEVATWENYRVYIPVNTMEDYHTSRWVEALNQQIYSNSGATSELLEKIMTEIVDRCNKEMNHDNFRTDIAALANSVKYRLKYPVDQHCSIRTGAILSFLEYEYDGKTISEDPEKTEAVWVNKKVDLALNVPSLYTFFLTWGVENTPKYKEHYDILNDTDYFSNRSQAIQSLLPESLR